MRRESETVNRGPVVQDGSYEGRVKRKKHFAIASCVRIGQVFENLIIVFRLL